MPVAALAVLLVPPAAPYPEWGVGRLAELTFAAAAGDGDAATLASSAVQAKGDRLDAATGPTLAVAHSIEAKLDDAVPFPIAIEAIETIREGSELVVRGLPDDVGLSHGQSLEPGAWRLDPRSAANLTLTLYRQIDGPQAISVELLGPDGDAIAAAATTLIVESAAAGRQSRLESDADARGRNAHPGERPGAASPRR